MNVAITRARMKLIILGDATTLTSHPFYKALYEYIREKGKDHRNSTGNTRHGPIQAKVTPLQHYFHSNVTILHLLCLRKKQNVIPDEVCYTNRELSWLSFNERVMQEAQDKSVPLIQRLRFLGIYSNNQDEFFKVRVANLERAGQEKERKG